MSKEKILIYEQSIGITIAELAEEIKHLVIIVAQDSSVKFRVKDPDTLRKKMLIKGTHDVFSIDDVYGIRILVKTVEESYRVLEKISQSFSGYLDHDFIKDPQMRIHEPHKGAMLRLLQFVAYKNGIPFEVQITTFAFHGVNESLHDGYHRRKYG